MSLIESCTLTTSTNPPRSFLTPFVSLNSLFITTTLTPPPPPPPPPPMSPPPSPTTTTTTAQWPTATMQQQQQQQQQQSATYAATGKIMFASVTTLVAVVVILLLLHLYSRWHLLRLHHRRRRRRRSRDNSNGGDLPSALAGRLDGAVLKSIPVVVFSSPEDDGGSPECAVCLSEFEDGDKCRKLNECKHCFHVECIDVWFCGNSTCPLCRSPVVVAGEPEVAILVDPPESSPESPGSPVVETTSLADMTKRVDVVIDESNRSELPASRLLSLKRMISMSTKAPASPSPSSAGVGPSCVGVAAELDVESTSHESSREVHGGGCLLRIKE